MIPYLVLVSNIVLLQIATTVLFMNFLPCRVVRSSRDRFIFFYREIRGCWRENRRMAIVGNSGGLAMWTDALARTNDYFSEFLQFFRLIRVYQSWISSYTGRFSKQTIQFCLYSSR